MDSSTQAQDAENGSNDLNRNTRLADGQLSKRSALSQLPARTDVRNRARLASGVRAPGSRPVADAEWWNLGVGDRDEMPRAFMRVADAVVALADHE